MGKCINFLNSAAASAATLLKVALMSRHPSAPPADSDDTHRIIVMGNGPSLRSVIDGHLPWLRSTPAMGVNFAANAPEFRQIVPSRYILADPHFFDGLRSDPNVERLWKNLASVDWDMTLHLPASVKGRHDLLGRLPKCVATAFYNLTPGEGWAALTHPLFRAGLAMPRPRNVLIPAIMEAIRAGYGSIILVGADHSWSRTLDVDDRNRVISVQPHFYKDSEQEQRRVDSEYAGYHLHDILHSLTVAFRSYHQIKSYATSRGVEILNATPGSMIDAFDRVAIEDLERG